MNKQELIQQLYEIDAIKLGDFLLKSGVRSPIYIDLRMLIAYPTILRNVANLMWQEIKHLNYQLICGVAYTALPIATCVSLDNGIPMLLCRKEQKDYGTKKRIEGKFSAGQRCLVFEDVITSGGSVLETVDILRQENLIVTDIIAFIDREQGGRIEIEKNNCKLFSVFTMTELLTGLRKICSKEESQVIEQLA